MIPFPVRTVYVVISCDTDPDREGFLDGVPSGRLTWRGMAEGIPAVKSLVSGLRDSAGRAPVFTWLLRADEQIRRIEGDYAWFARTQQSLLRELEESGDELGWHPHFWRRDEENGAWFQEIDDVDWQVDMLHQAHRALVTALPHPPRSVRMGWTYHNNRTCQALEQLGIAVDFSALPGFRTLTARPPARGENLFDWFSTPRAPYRPSRADYRRPARDGESSCRLLEVPTFVSTSVMWSLVGGLQMARKTGQAAQLWYAVRRPSYCINVTARPRLFAPLVAQLRKALRGPPLPPAPARSCSRPTFTPTSWCRTEAGSTTWRACGRISRPCCARVKKLARPCNSSGRGTCSPCGRIDGVRPTGAR